MWAVPLNRGGLFLLTEAIDNLEPEMWRIADAFRDRCRRHLLGEAGALHQLGPLIPAPTDNGVMPRSWRLRREMRDLLRESY